MDGPVVVVVAYPSTTESGALTSFDMDHYLSVHMVLIDKHWKPFGMKNWVVTVLKPEDSLDGSTPPYCVQATISWDTIEDFKEAMARGSEETKADIPKYTNVQPHIWISRAEATCGTNGRAKV